MSIPSEYIDKTRDLALQLRQQLFIGVEVNATAQGIVKIAGVTPKKERLLNLLEVKELSSDKSGEGVEFVLCLTVKKNRHIRLHRVKRQGHGFAYSNQWTLDEIRAIEHKSETSFSLLMSNPHEFRTYNSVQTESFIQMLVGYCNKHSSKPPRYINAVGTINQSKLSQKSENRGNVKPSAKSSKLEKKNKTQKSNKTVKPIPPQEKISTEANKNTKISTPFQNSPVKKEDISNKPSQSPPQRQTDSPAAINRSGPAIEDENNIRLDQIMEDIDDFQPNNEDLLLDQTFMLSAEELLGSFGWKANVDAAELEAHLLKELSKLEPENVKDMLEADKKVPTVIAELDNAINELEMIDNLLINYCDELDSLGNEVRQIQVENENLKIEEVNQQNLLKELENFLRAIQVPEEQAQFLRSELLESQQGIDRVIKVASLLQEKISMRLSGGLEETEAFRDRKSKYEFYASNFSTRVFDYLKTMFQFKSEGALDKQNRSIGKRIYEISVSNSLHESLINYCGLTLWLKENKPAYDRELQALYIQCMNKVYNKEGNDLLDSCRPFLFKYRNVEVNYLFVQPASTTQQSQFSYGMRRGSQDNDNYLQSMGGANGPNANTDLQPHGAFGQGLDTVIRNIVSEQNFLADLFHYAPYIKKNLSSKPPKDLKNKANEDLLSLVTFYEYANGVWVPLKDWETPRMIWSSENLVKNVKSMLDLLFGNIKIHIDSMIDMGTRYDPSQSLGMLAAVEEKMIETKNTDLEFVQKMLGEMNAKLTSIFQQMVSQQLANIEEKKFSAKKRIGVQPMVRIFPKFVEHLEIMTFKKGQPSGYVPSTKKLGDEASSKIGQKILDIFNNLVRDAQKAMMQSYDKDSAKEYTNALIIALENVSCLRDGLDQTNKKLVEYAKMNQDQNLSKSKNTVTESAVSKQFYDISLRIADQLQQSYVTEALKKPFGKLIEFFNGVQDTLARSNQSIEHSSAYNRNALRKLLNAHNTKEVKEIIKTIYKRVDKHFFQQPKLMRGVWVQVSQGILNMQQGFNNIIKRAYSETGVTFDYRQTDLLQWLDEFS